MGRAFFVFGRSMMKDKREEGKGGGVLIDDYRVFGCWFLL